MFAAGAIATANQSQGAVAAGGSGGAINAGGSTASATGGVGVNSGGASAGAGANVNQAQVQIPQNNLQPTPPNNNSVNGTQTGNNPSSGTTTDQNNQNGTQSGALSGSNQQQNQALSPTGQPIDQNRRFQNSNTNGANSSANNTGMRDQAITPADQAMLMQMRASAFPPGTDVATSSSVSFILKDGAVRLVGTVPSVAEQQRIAAAAQQTPGITRVYNAMRVATPVGGSATISTGEGTTTGSGSATPPTPTPVGPGVPPQTPPIALNPTNYGLRTP